MRKLMPLLLLFLFLSISLTWSQVVIMDTVILDSGDNILLAQTSESEASRVYNISLSINISKIQTRSKITLTVGLIGNEIAWDCPAGGCGGDFITRAYNNSSSNYLRIAHYDYVTSKNVSVDYEEVETGIYSTVQYKIWFNYGPPLIPINVGTLTVYDVTPIPIPGSYQFYCQGNSIWSGDDYDHHPNGAKISGAGCALCCVAMVMDYFGVLGVTPKTLNTWMKDHDGFDEDAKVYWSKINLYPGNDKVKYGAKKGKGLKFLKDEPKYVDIAGSESRKRNLSEMDEYLEKGIPVIVQVANFHSSIGKYRPHFVLVTSKDPTKTGAAAYNILDPGKCNSSSSLTDYYNGNIYSITYFETK